MALVIDRLCKRFGDVQALDGISLAVQPGQVFGFLGPNGAGKTTTMRIVLDILHPDGGSVTWRDVPRGERSAKDVGLPARRWATTDRDATSGSRRQGPSSKAGRQAS